ncbi:MAG TPA: PrsW family intramembrane metalloprotease [Trebonia sp.]|jgi:RsiW-degrading membrane proteinase PrsW (M82 family)|nr:PrsW family intramembrane metalloprotease [Trebonia sp.]
MAPKPPTAVLDSRRFGRTPRLFLLGLALCSLVALAALAVVVGQRGTAPTLVGLILALLPFPLLVALILLIDRLEPEPRALLAIIFGAGAGLAVLIALLGHATGSDAIAGPELGPHAGRAVAIGLGSAIGAAVVAESLKGLVLLALLRSRRTEIDGATDGVVYASMVGLGFALVANVYAYATAWNSGIGSLADQFARRGIFGPLWEALFTSMTGLGVAYAAQRKGASGYWAIAVGWVAAIVLDTLWNDSVDAGGGALAITYLVLIVVLVVVIILVAGDWRRIVALIREYLPQYADPVTATPVDINMLTTLRSRRLGRQWAKLNLGRAAIAPIIQYQLAATELAMACGRNQQGRLTPEQFTRHRDDSLALMREAVAVIRGYQQLYPPTWAGELPSAFVP